MSRNHVYISVINQCLHILHRQQRKSCTPLLLIQDMYRLCTVSYTRIHPYIYTRPFPESCGVGFRCGKVICFQTTPLIDRNDVVLNSPLSAVFINAQTTTVTVRCMSLCISKALTVPLRTSHLQQRVTSQLVVAKITCYVSVR